ncbi:MAG: DUF1576 domain-containing protein [Firmicutes bacterium]|nr:DUF1576 domain-containing protein [Bacillota bacterium]
MLEQRRYLIMIAYLVSLIIAGSLWPGEQSLLLGYAEILRAPGLLISDYFSIGGTGPALINAGLVGCFGLFVVYLSGASLSGPTMAGVFTMAGFALFGKTPLNIWPIIAGVALAAKIKKESLSTYILAALFGTALGPVVSVMTFALSMPYVISAASGLLIGLVLPALTGHVLHNHQGLNLYNVGFTCGIIGVFATAFLKSQGFIFQSKMIWSTGDQRSLAVFFSIYFASMLVIGWSGRAKVRNLWTMPGTLITDFISEHGLPATFFNMGLVGLIGMLYIALVGGDYNGPTLGAVFTMVGFAAFGKHVLNIWPIMLGVYLGSLFSVWNANDPGVLLAALFGTTLAPIAGTFGPFIGVVAGAIHLAVVMHSGPFHGGMNLYNNGFAGGIVATLLASIARWSKRL